jgi:hypothetical protein
MDRVGWWLPWAVVCACASEDAPARRSVFDFEADEAPWVVGAGNLHATPSQRQIKVHRHGEAFLDSAEGSTKREHELFGVLISPSFVIDHPYLVLRAGATEGARQCWLELRDARTNSRLRKITTATAFEMETHVVDVEGLVGRTVRMQLVDLDGCSLHLDWVRLVDG